MATSETRLQQDCVVWFKNTFPDLRLVLWHTENEGKRNGRQQMIFKTMGGCSGVADLLFFYGGELYAFELKTAKGRQSPTQIDWQTAIEKQGATYRIVRSIGEFKYYINGIVNAKS